MMRVGWIQTQPIYGNPAANLASVEARMSGAGADLWVLPELFSTGYLFGSREEAARLAESIPDGPTTQGLIALAGRAKCAIVAGLVERTADGRLFNAAVGVNADGMRAHYRKIHLFDLEKTWFEPGDRGFQVVSLGGAQVGIMICFDWRFPEAARALALRGAQVIAHPANLVQPYCQASMITRAMENRVFTITANRIGVERRGDVSLTFTGASRIVGPDGRVLSDGAPDRVGLNVVTIDPAKADDKMVTERNHLLTDRRPEHYYETGGGNLTLF